jgi:hypothetical protein
MMAAVSPTHCALLFQSSQILQCQSNTDDRFVIAGVVRVGGQCVTLTTLYVGHIANAGEVRLTVLTGHQSVAVALDPAPGFFNIAEAGSIG